LRISDSGQIETQAAKIAASNALAATLTTTTRSIEADNASKHQADQPHRAGRLEIRNRAFDIFKRQMHERVAAQDRVASRQRVAGDIGEMIFALDFPGSRTGLQALDQRRHDIDADGAHAQIRLIDPAGVAAGRIEQCGHAEFFEQPR